MRWQKRARLVVAIFGIGVAAAVFFAIGEREPPKAAPAVERMDPNAVIETSGCDIRRLTALRQDFRVTCDRQLAYEDGTSKLYGVRIDLRERQGRDFVIVGDEAVANDKAREISLTGGVKLTASDGFELTTGTASFRESDGIVRTPGAVSFGRGQMSGRGVGMTYDRNADILTIAQQAHVTFVDEEGASSGEFAAGAATLDRTQNFLALEGSVHAVRDGQTIDAERARAHLTEKEEAITSIELRGSARVAGGSTAFEAMSARDIDLDYSDDGETLEGARLAGAATIGLKGQSGGAGRRMSGESLTLALAPDGAVTSAVGRDGVQLELPAGEGTPARQVKARTLDAEGAPGKGLTSARFRDDVQFREETGEGTAPRTAQSRTLAVALDGETFDSAVFSGRVRFADGRLSASAAGARYEPAKGVLRLEGSEDGEGPRVADERIAIEAESIDVTLEGPSMIASGGVKTRLRASDTAPGLLTKEQPANVSANRLEYGGDPRRAVYSGAAQLWQGDTAIRADRITLDQGSGNLLASGNARSTLSIDGAASVGRAEEVRYDNEARQITYTGAIRAAPVGATAAAPAGAIGAGPVGGVPAAPAGANTTSPGRATTAAPAGLPAQLSGPQGDLTAARIVVILAKEESRMDRLEASGGVTLRLDDRVASGAQLTFHAADERYVMTGAAAAPVRVVEPCRETTGSTLTFFKSTDRIVVDGNEQIRTRTTSGGGCPQPPSAR
jgi:lipopolysaccharide export system protein LptA